MIWVLLADPSASLPLEKGLPYEGGGVAAFKECNCCSIRASRYHSEFIGTMILNVICYHG